MNQTRNDIFSKIPNTKILLDSENHTFNDLIGMNPVLHQLYLFSEGRDILALNSVSKRFRNIGTSDLLWTEIFDSFPSYFPKTFRQKPHTTLQAYRTDEKSEERMYDRLVHFDSTFREHHRNQKEKRIEMTNIVGKWRKRLDSCIFLSLLCFPPLTPLLTGLLTFSDLQYQANSDRLNYSNFKLNLFRFCSCLDIFFFSFLLSLLFLLGPLGWLVSVFLALFYFLGRICCRGYYYTWECRRNRRFMRHWYEERSAVNTARRGYRSRQLFRECDMKYFWIHNPCSACTLIVPSYWFIRGNFLMYFLERLVDLAEKMGSYWWVYYWGAFCCFISCVGVIFGVLWVIGVVVLVVLAAGGWVIIMLCVITCIVPIFCICLAMAWSPLYIDW